MAEMVEEDNKSKNTFKSKLSLDSVQEISRKNRALFSLSLILLNIISFILGIYILYNNDYYLNKEFKFSNQISLFIFIIIYTFGMLLALIISFIFALIIKVIYYYKNKNNYPSETNDKSNCDLSSNEHENGRLSIFILSNKKNDVALIPFALSYFIIFTIGIYFIALPYALILIIKLFQNDYLSKVFSFFLLYLFMLVNFLAGLIMVMLLFYIVFMKKRENIRKPEYNIDNENINNIRNEIRNAMK